MFFVYFFCAFARNQNNNEIFSNHIISCVRVCGTTKRQRSTKVNRVKCMCVNWLWPASPFSVSVAQLDSFVSRLCLFLPSSMIAFSTTKQIISSAPLQSSILEPMKCTYSDTRQHFKIRVNTHHFSGSTAKESLRKESDWEGGKKRKNSVTDENNGIECLVFRTLASPSRTTESTNTQHTLFIFTHTSKRWTSIFALKKTSVHDTRAIKQQNW